jgi:hypothetical protein
MGNQGASRERERESKLKDVSRCSSLIYFFRISFSMQRIAENFSSF